MNTRTRVWMFGLPLMAALSFCLWLVTTPATPSEVRWPARLELRSAQGPFGLAQLHGRVSLLYFGYTYCPSLCPLTLAHVGQALRRLAPSERDEVRGVFVSVDPSRDTPERLRTYAAYFDPSIVGLTGNDAALRELTERFQAPFEKHTEAGESDYGVDHSSALYVLDRQGRLLRTLDDPGDANQIVAAVREALAEDPPRHAAR